MKSIVSKYRKTYTLKSDGTLYDENGVVRSSDHYNKYGALYARTIFNHKGQRVNRSYFDTNGKEVIVENFVTKSIILNEGETVRIFQSKLDFLVYFFEKAELTKHRIFFNLLTRQFVAEFIINIRHKTAFFAPILIGKREFHFHGHFHRIRQIIKDKYRIFPFPCARLVHNKIQKRLRAIIP